MAEKDSVDFDRETPWERAEKETRKTTTRVPADKPLDAAMTKTELRKNIFFVFNGIARAFRLPNVEDFPDRDLLRFDEDEFDDSAEAFMIIANQHSEARVLFRIISPLAGLGALVNAFARLIAAFELKRQLDRVKRENQRAAQSTALPTDQPVEVGENGKQAGVQFPFIGRR